MPSSSSSQCQYTQPLTTDDVWTVLSDTDGSVTLAALASGTLPSSGNITHGHVRREDEPRRVEPRGGDH